jgi:hypothetical protein
MTININAQSKPPTTSQIRESPSIMGIKSTAVPSTTINSIDLHQLISDQCPDAVKASEIKNYFGRKVAIVSSSL